jgi:hypothetical protein
MASIVAVSLAAILSTSCTYLSELFGGPESVSFRGIPSRSFGAMTGTEFAREFGRVDSPEREDLILREANRGNVPDLLRKFVAVKIDGRTSLGKKMSAVIYVAPDYFAIGSDGDYLRVPMTPMTAQRICDRFGLIMPTRKMVNEIYRAAAVKIGPQPLPPGDQMTGVPYYERHNRMVQSTLGARAKAGLIGGHKKDIVNSVLIQNRPLQVAIYGWHRLNGQAIQPLSLVHINTYADYSHGMRMIRSTMLIDGKSWRVSDALKHPEYSKLLSDEGAVSKSTLPTNAHPRWLHRSVAKRT